MSQPDGTPRRSRTAWLTNRLAGVPLPLRMGLGLLLAVLLVFTGYLIPRRVSNVGTVDDSSTWRAAEAPPTREVVWKEAEPLGVPANERLRLAGPRLADRGLTLYLTIVDERGKADLHRCTLGPRGWSDPEPLAALNTTHSELGPTPSADGTRLYFYSDRPGGEGGFDLYVAERTGTIWSAPANLGPAVNSPADDYDPAPTPDGLDLFFASNRVARSTDESSPAPETSDRWSATVRARRGSFDLFRSERPDVDGDWGAATAVAEWNRDDAHEGSPFVSPDGAFVYFASDRPARAGEPRNLDLYRGRLKSNGFGEPEPLGPSVNTAAHETEPGLSPQGFTLVFASDRTGIDRLYSSDAAEVERQTSWESPGLAAIPSLLWWLLLWTLLAVLFGLASIYWRQALRDGAVASRCLVGSLLVHLLIFLLLAWWTLPEILGTSVADDDGGGAAVGMPLPSQGTGRRAFEEVADIDPVERATFEEMASLPTEVVSPEELRPEPLPSDAPPTPVRRATSAVLSDVRPVPVPVRRRVRVQPFEKSRVMPRPTEPIELTEVPLPNLPEPSTKPIEPEPQPVRVNDDASPAPPEPAENPSPQAVPTSVPRPVPAKPRPVTSTLDPAKPALEPRTTAPSLPSRRSSAAPVELAELDFGDLPDIVGPEAVNEMDPEESRETGGGPIDVTFERTTDSEADDVPDTSPASNVEPPVADRPIGPVITLDSPFDPRVGPTSPRTTTASPFNPVRSVPSAIEVAELDGVDLPEMDATEDVDPAEPSTPAPADASEGLERQAVQRSDDEPARLPAETFSPDLPRRRPLALAELSAATTTRPGPVRLRALDGPVRRRPSTTRLSTAAEMPSLQALLVLRQGPARKEFLELAGGDAGTDEAVRLGLKWLADHQNEDGRWSLHEFHRDGKKLDKGVYKPGDARSDAAATGLALLPFLAAGHTHLHGEYRETVARGLDWLVEHQKEDGDLFTDSDQQIWMYSHGIATIALCEAHGLEPEDGRYRDAATTAVRFVEQAQNPKTGGWRYKPWKHNKGERGDTSVVGWQVMALKSAEMAGITVDREVYEQTHRWLESVESQKPPGRFGYTNRSSSPAMTAEALLCLQFLGVDRNDPRMLSGADYLLQRLPEKNQRDTSYSWYYATQVMYHMQGDDYWEPWNERMKAILKETQHRSGPLAGTWEPRGNDQWEKRGGRLYATCLKLLVLEVYHRHLPLFDQLRE